jgi:SAM-dependent methyltransferase
MSSWDLGHYEEIAVDLLPAAAVTVRAAAPKPGERVLDIGCGNGNAALLAAAEGATVIGVDPAARLLESARAEAAARGLQASFVVGEAGALPLKDASVDVVLSVFGVIFAPDARATAAEVARVSGSRARAVITAWLPAGPIAEVMTVRGQAIASATGAGPPSPPFSWHDEAALGSLFAPHGFEVALAEHRLSFTASSAEAFLDLQLREHPNWVACRDTLAADGRLDRLRQDALAILRAANEDPGGFRVTSRYVIATANRKGGV